jgi:hypothetical protein
MPHVRRRHHPREPKELDRGAGPVSSAESDDGCRRSQEAWRARLSLGDPGHQALPRGLRSAAENRDVRPGAVRSDDGAVPALGSQSVVVDVRRLDFKEENKMTTWCSLERPRLAIERWQGLYRRRLLSQRADGSNSRPDEGRLRNHFRQPQRQHAATGCQFRVPDFFGGDEASCRTI